MIGTRELFRDPLYWKFYTGRLFQVSVKTLPFYKDYFGIAYPLPKIDLITIADFSAGELFIRFSLTSVPVMNSFPIWLRFSFILPSVSVLISHTMRPIFPSISSSISIHSAPNSHPLWFQFSFILLPSILLSNLFHFALKSPSISPSSVVHRSLLSTCVILNKSAAICVRPGAMENWGLVTYRENALLIDAENSSAAARQRVALVVGHELAHQWFGNLVTMVSDLRKGKEKGKLGTYAMKRAAEGAHLPTPWLFEPPKRPDDRADYCLDWKGITSKKMGNNHVQMSNSNPRKFFR